MVKQYPKTLVSIFLKFIKLNFMRTILIAMHFTEPRHIRKIRGCWRIKEAKTSPILVIFNLESNRIESRERRRSDSFLNCNPNSVSDQIQLLFLVNFRKSPFPNAFSHTPPIPFSISSPQNVPAMFSHFSLLIDSFISCCYSLERDFKI